MKLKNLFILGDIGFLNNNLQTVVNQVSNQIQVDDIITVLGDNFYPNGVSSLNDYQWDTYNDIFKNVKNPVYSILGNHDYLQNPKAQIYSDNWIMDGWYFKKEFDNIDLYFLDTSQFNLEWVPNDILKKNHNLESEILIENQINWLSDELEKNKDKKKLVFGHYPLISNGVYAKKLDKMYNSLIDIFVKYNVNIYISGHEHNIQYINRKIDSLDFNQLIIGSSSENRNDVDTCIDIDMIDNKEIFFGKLSINNDNFEIKYFNKLGELKHNFKIQN